MQKKVRVIVKKIHTKNTFTRRKLQLSNIIETMIAVCPEKYATYSLKKAIWINDCDFFEQVFVKKFGCTGVRFVYGNPNKKESCSVGVLFLPKKVVFHEKWDSIKEELLNIERSFQDQL